MTTHSGDLWLPTGRRRGIWRWTRLLQCTPAAATFRRPCVSTSGSRPVSRWDATSRWLTLTWRQCGAGYDLVRRPTGGRAILHTDELTYSVAGPADDPTGRRRAGQSYLRLSQGLLAGLERPGLRSQSAADQPLSTADAGPVCFSAQRLRLWPAVGNWWAARTKPPQGLGLTAWHTPLMGDIAAGGYAGAG